MFDPASAQLKEYFEKGNAFFNQGQLVDAVTSYRIALAAGPDVPEVLANLAAALHGLGRKQEAEEAIAHCLQLKPDYADALNTLGNIRKSTGDFVGAVNAYHAACKTTPQHLAAWMNLGQLLHQEKQYEAAIVAYQQALKINPRQMKALGELSSMLHLLCRWNDMQAIDARLQQAMMQGGVTEPFVAALYAPPLALENASRYSALHYPYGKAYTAATPLPALARGDGKLRIGYLSADFYRHATAHLISELFEKHDRRAFAIYAYSHGKDDASLARARIMQSVDQFHDIAQINDADAAALIRKDGIDILIDLKGYTETHRLSLMAQRPAPLQMHYLGYPGTTGAAFMDYFIADAISAPGGADAVFSEKLIRVPHSYQINDRKRNLPAHVTSRTAAGLPAEGFIFCAFNQSFKFTPELFAVWMRLLAATQGSVLWLYETHPEASATLKREAQKHGVDPARIIIAGLLPPEEHLARLQHADLFLDSFPCNAHTTASDMLWCAVPVVTLAGEPFISRVAASLLHAVDLPQLVTHTLEAYEALALSLARDKTKLAALRKHLQEGRMQFPLFDSAATTRALEAAYLDAAERHRKGASPQGFAVSADLAIV